MEREKIDPGVDRAIEEMESGREEMDKRSDELNDRVDAVRNKWHARQADSQVPGAVPPEEESSDEAQEETEGDEATEGS